MKLVVNGADVEVADHHSQTLADAIAALSGSRIRDLPFSKTIKIYMPDVTITPSENGPYIVSGPVVLTAPEGE